jgi:hypothetical protein
LNWIRRCFTIGSALVATISMVALLSTSAGAYGPANWQTAFSGNFNTPGSGNSGFWGWCDFVGSTSGTDADCSLANYFFGATGASTGFLASERIHGSAWDEEPCSPMFCLFPGAQDFFITAGTVTLSGPSIAQAVKAGMVPTGPGQCTVAGTVATCPISVLEPLGIYSPDTGIPAAAGHYALRGIFGSPGSHVMVQVNSIR